MKMPSEKLLKELREMYPKGTRVELVEMNDPQAPPIGTKGMVYGIDDMASMLVNWDNGSRINVIYGVDKVKKIMDGKINEQILEIRDSGLTNMFDEIAVQNIAYEREFYELVKFIEEQPKEYFDLILHGKRLER